MKLCRRLSVHDGMVDGGSDGDALVREESDLERQDRCGVRGTGNSGTKARNSDSGRSPLLEIQEKSALDSATVRDTVSCCKTTMCCRILWVPLEVTGEWKEVDEGEGKGSLEFGENIGVEGVAR